MGQWPVIGHDWAVRQLQQAVAEGEVPHALLITGPEDVGKATLALTVAAALLCTAPPAERPCGTCSACRRVASRNHPDLLVVEPEAEGGSLKIEPIRDLERFMILTPAEARSKLAIIQHFERATPSAANALLKTLEEPPAYAHLILLATDADTLLPTVVSRSQHFALRPLSRLTVQQALQQRWGAAPEVAEQLARLSCGRLGWAVQALTDPQRRQQIDEAVLKWLTLLRQELPARFVAAAELAKDPVQLALVLEMWQLAWRDVLLLQTENAEGITYLEQQAALREVATSVTVGQTVNALKTLEQAQEALRRNANALLLTENLLLDLPTLR